MKLMTAIQALCLSTILIMNLGCAEKSPAIQYVNIPQRCSVPNIMRPIIDNAPCDDYKCIAAKVTGNFAIVRTYSEELEAALDTCR